MKPTPHPVDTNVGQKIRERRKTLGLTQTDLADACGIKFQQIQKYETGMNRVSASRLFQIAELLKVEIGFFWQGLESAHATGAKPDHLAARTREEADLLTGFRQCPTQVRASLVEIAKLGGAS